MTRAEILEKNLKLLEEGIVRIRKSLPRMMQENRDLTNSVIVYSRTALRVVRNIEVEVTGKPQKEISKLYLGRQWENEA